MAEEHDLNAPLDNADARPAASVDRRKNGVPSRMRSHPGNVPILPQTKLCPHCPAKFTRTTHLNRHMRTHTNERVHHCDTCDAQFTRSDLLTRHKRTCGDPTNAQRTRRKSCKSCADSKIKCDLQQPCSKCKSRGRDCIYLPVGGAPAGPSNNTTPPSDESSDTAVNGNTPPEDKSAETSKSPEDIHRVFTGLGLSNRPTSPAPTESTLSTYVSEFDPVSSHLSNRYSNDMFQPFFNTLFSTAEEPADEYARAATPQPSTAREPDPPPIRYDTIDMPPNPPPLAWGGEVETMLQGFYVAQPDYRPPLPAFPPTHVAMPQPMNANGMPPKVELHQYMYLFVSTFLDQMPIAHGPTLQVKDMSIVLICAMKACGALYLKTRAANNYIKVKLEDAREQLMTEFAKNSTDRVEQSNLILAVVLLQTIALFHQSLEQRETATMYHGMLVMMIRHSSLIAENAAWVPPDLNKTPLETAWREWARHETTKRALLLSWMQDNCHVIYFGLPPMYHKGEMSVCLPCEDALWKATSASEWYLLLQDATPAYGDINARLTGVSTQTALAQLMQPRPVNNPTHLNPFAHLLLIHAILKDLSSPLLPGDANACPAAAAASPEERVEQHVYMMQFGLHNWLQSWLASPDLLAVTTSENEEPPYLFNALPYYWLGQVSLLAYQEGIPPFEHGPSATNTSEVRFRMTKLWLRHIRGFLRRNDQEPTLFWDQLMQIRLHNCVVDICVPDHEGLLGFFQDQQGKHPRRASLSVRSC
ncbi:hypothetical protein PLICRDRAFT_103263 [Plicaturopsis crispa FD-325 SS-3]|nr:hypothetical protein PLICRDRAFT_103263 [Plicaturopsis crispa FD-325 SS-3]